MLIAGGTAFVDGALRKLDVRVENGCIAEVGELTPRPGEEVRSAQGQYVLPGFVDIHIHAYGGADCMRGEKDVRQMSRGLLDTGVAAFVPTTMSAWPSETYEALAGIQAVMDKPELRGAAVLGAHMEAPFLSPAFKGAQLGECLREPSVEAYMEMVRELRCVRMMTLAPELPGALDMARRLRPLGVRMSIGHSDALYEEVLPAYEAGFD